METLMEFRKINAPTLKELFIQQLENMILSGNLPIGSKLPSERELAESMGVSRAVVNSGITDLAHIGFLTIKPRVGTFVADYRRDGTMDTLNAIMKYNGGTLRPDEVRSILELRIALDTLAVQLCLSHCTDAELQHLNDLASRIASADSGDQAAEYSYEFQHELALYSNNTLIPLIFSSFKQPIITLWKRFYTLYGITTLYHNVAVLCKYIQKRDVKGANEWLRASITNTINGDTQIYF